MIHIQKVSPGYQGFKTPLLVLIHDRELQIYEEAGSSFEADATRLRKRFEKDKLDREAYVTRGESAGIEDLLFFDTSCVKYLELPEKIKTIASRALSFARKYSVERVSFALNGADGARALTWVAEGCLLGDYRFERYKSKTRKHSLKIDLVVDQQHEKGAKVAVEQVSRICDSVNYCRDLINEPSAMMYPESLAEHAREVCREGGMECEVLDEKQLQEQGYNGIYSVGKASVRQPRLIIMRYKPDVSGPMHLALVGKAITFDTGGYTLKSSRDMWEMKGDMAGGAAVISALRVLSKTKPALRITAIVPAAQNMIGGDAFLPGDIITTRIGKTVHVDNTDAEGRLILMDALIRAHEEGATHVIDAATLTGSVVRALGLSVAGAFGTEQDLVDRIIAAGRRVGEEFWQLPLVPEYRDMLNSDIADIDNSGRSPNAGAIVAALFLKEFVHESLKWAHLDIAGTFLADKAWKYLCAGATGFGVKTFVEVAQELAAENQEKMETEPKQAKKKKMT